MKKEYRQPATHIRTIDPHDELLVNSFNGKTLNVDGGSMEGGDGSDAVKSESGNWDDIWD